MLVSGGRDNSVRIWSLKEKKQIRMFRPYLGVGIVVDVAFLNDGRRVASCGSDRRVRIWSLGDNDASPERQAHEAQITSLSTSRDGKLLASASFDGEVRLWRILRGELKEIHRTRDHKSGDVLVRFPSTGGTEFISVGADGVIRLLEGKDGTLVQTFQSPGSVTIADCIPQKNLLVCGGGRQVYLLNAETNETLWSWDSIGDFATVVTDVRLSQDGSRVIASCGDAAVFVWDATTGQEILCVDNKKVNFETILQGRGNFAASSNGKLFAMGCADNAIRLFTTDDGSEVARLSGHTGWPLSVCFHPDSDRLVTGGADGTVRLWEVSSGAEVMLKRLGLSAVTALTVTADGQTILCGTPDGQLYVWYADKHHL